MSIELQSAFHSDLPELAVEWSAAPPPEPVVVAFNAALAAELGLDGLLDRDDAAQVLTGTALPEGARPVAMAYAGHQFGNYSPVLGDGRALLLGELIDLNGNRRDLHLKGSGATPFSRGGDGKAALGPMLREFLVSEAMHALGIPTARTLAVVATGETVARDGGAPGAVLARVASSHLRVGTFEYAARLADGEVLRRVADTAIARHHPGAARADNPYLGLLDAVIAAQARLVAGWMHVGFIHGVMNTDNTTISGETIDYGPCAFMDRHNPSTVFSSIDHGGRYAYGNQPGITQWNLARFAETLLPLIDDDHDAAVAAATERLRAFPDRYRADWTAGMHAKLGLSPTQAHHDPLVDELVDLMTAAGADHTLTFRALADMLRGEDAALHTMFHGHGIGAWVERWRDDLAASGLDPAASATAMDAINPLYIPRNHLVEEALSAATAGDLEPFRQLLIRVTNPFVEQAGANRYAEPAPAGFDASYRTFCGT